MTSPLELFQRRCNALRECTASHPALATKTKKWDATQRVPRCPEGHPLACVDAAITRCALERRGRCGGCRDFRSRSLRSRIRWLQAGRDSDGPFLRQLETQHEAPGEAAVICGVGLDVTQGRG